MSSGNESAIQTPHIQYVPILLMEQRVSVRFMGAGHDVKYRKAEGEGDGDEKGKKTKQESSVLVWKIGHFPTLNDLSR